MFPIGDAELFTYLTRCDVSDEEEQAVPKLVDGEASEEDESEEESDDEEGVSSD